MSDLDSDGFTHVEKNQVIGEENLEGREKRSEEKSFIMQKSIGLVIENKNGIICGALYGLQNLEVICDSVDKLSSSVLFSTVSETKAYTANWSVCLDGTCGW